VFPLDLDPPQKREWEGEKEKRRGRRQGGPLGPRRRRKKGYERRGEKERKERKEEKVSQLKKDVLINFLRTQVELKTEGEKKKKKGRKKRQSPSG